MTFFAACAWSLLRSLTVAVVGAGIASQLMRTLTVAPGRKRTALWGMTLLPLFVPGLLIGYGYRNFSLSLVHHPVRNEIVYGVLVLLMVVPVGTLILVCSPPPPLGASALHMRRLAMSSAPSSPMNTSSGMVQKAKRGLAIAPFWLRSHLFSLLPACAVMFLLAFQETEVAALVQARGWPEWMFTRLAAGLSPTNALIRLLGPIVMQLAVLGSAFWIVWQRGSDHSVGPHSAISGASRESASWGYLLGAVTCLLLIPGGIVLEGTFTGIAVLAAHPGLMRQIGITLLFGVTTGLLAWVTSGWIVERLTRRAAAPLVGILLLPGLMGAWALGLSLTGLFQTPLLRPLYGTPLPMILGETLLQLPRAALIRLLQGRWRRSASVHSARLLVAAPDRNRRGRAAEVMWELDTRGRIVGALLVCYWASLELTIPSPALLAPPGLTSAPVLLYNQMHYGQIPGLSALVFATIAVPVVCLIGVSLAARWLTIRLHPSYGSTFHNQ